MYLAERLLERYVNCVNFSPIYQLYALIKHIGSGNSGHYVAICKKYINNLNNSVWVEFDD